MYNKAIVRRPCKEIVRGLSSSDLGKPDYNKAVEQHALYIEALQECGLGVRVLDADSNFPDSTFVEDTALLTPACAIITNPGADSRKGETIEIHRVLKDYFENIERIVPPATVDAGDIIMVGSHFYIGLSQRTNTKGAQQLIEILNKYSMTGVTVHLENVLHLKTGVSYLDNNAIMAIEAFSRKKEFQQFKIIKLDKDEGYAANCL